MKLRYQMRGLGIGIFVTALLMGVATKEGRPLTDAEIKAKAYELGMVDGDSVTLADLKGSTSDSQKTAAPQETMIPQETAAPQETMIPQETAAPQETMIPQETAAPQETMVPQETAAPQETMIPQETAAPQETMIPQETAAPQETEMPAATSVPEPDNNGSGEAVTIVIKRGANSYSVSVQLAEAGLIENAAAFDSYLCNNGYAGKIRTGTYHIVPGTSEEQIAEIIAGIG